MIIQEKKTRIIWFGDIIAQKQNGAKHPFAAIDEHSVAPDYLDTICHLWNTAMSRHQHSDMDTESAKKDFKRQEIY